MPLVSRRPRSRSLLASLLAATGLALAACGGRARPSAEERQAIARTIEREVRDAYDLSKPGAETRMLSLYADSGRVISASGGRLVSTRDSIALGIRAFWQFVGANMRDPQWIWDRMLVDVLSRDAAVMTATYHVPHHTPRGDPHTIGGAWTAVFVRRGDQWVIVQEHLSDLPAAQMAPMPGMPDMPGMQHSDSTGTHRGH